MSEDGTAAMTSAQAEQIIQLLDTIAGRLTAIEVNTSTSADVAEWFRRRIEATEDLQRRMMSRNY